MLDGGIITGLLTIVGAGSFIGEEVAKEAIKHYAPKAFSRLDETIESIWSSVRSGDVKEAERQVEESGLAETIVTSAAELQRQTVVLSVPEMENEYVSRVRALEKAVNYAFELSRRWKIGLLAVWCG